VNRDAQHSSEVTRRSILRTAAAAIGTAVSPSLIPAAARSQATPAEVGDDRRSNARQATASSFLDLIRLPDEVTTFDHFEKTLPKGRLLLSRSGEKWVGKGMVVECGLAKDSLTLGLESPQNPVVVVHVRWQMTVPLHLLVLSDAWERSYGELGWRNVIPERVMPWYFATHDGSACHGYGVTTDARTLCFWQVDLQGVSLWLNVTNGGNGIELGERKLAMATIVSRRGTAGEDAIETLAELCRRMCRRKTHPTIPIYGANDWCYSYGQSSAETILRDTEFIVDVSPTGVSRPFSVIDGGWAEGTAAWPDMGRLAADIKRRNARPGLWLRPLEAPENTASHMVLSAGRFGERKERARELAYDPTVAEAREAIRAKLRQAAGWGYEMVKHDFSTYDLLGQWGFEMGPQPTLAGWSLSDRSRTNAEVIADLYSLLRDAVGDQIVLDGCNTIGHLGQGIFDLQRVGDDTSGHQWERTRRMGVNALSFRLPQQGTFFTVDADLVGMTDDVPWAENRQWLDLLARSGTATLVSVAPSQRGPDQRAALREAFEIAAAGGADAKPVDWMETSTPQHWRGKSGKGGAGERRYDWAGQEGACPFLSP
jgi:alpha-galactosidase